MKLKYFSLFCALFISSAIVAQDFDTYFTNQTLRIDYQFAGYRKPDIKIGEQTHKVSEQTIYLQNLYRVPGWAGRRNRLSELPLDGNYQLTVMNAATGTVIYRYSFSTLFSEWLDTDEATRLQRAFSNTFLIPYPKEMAVVTVSARTRQGTYEPKITHFVDPADILIRPIGERNVTPHEVIMQSGPVDKCIDIAFVAEGYQEHEMDTFVADAKRCMESILAHEPFTSMKARFNVIAVKSVSKESGVSIPRDNDWKQNLFGSHFDTFYSQRYLTSSDIHGINDQLAGLPYEQIIVLGNSSIYGGGGVYNSFTIADAHNEQTLPVVVHEFGHTFGGLGDEYGYDDDMKDFYPRDVEPWEQNITTKVNFASKWEDMYNAGQAELHEGAGYTTTGVFRPMADCRMRSNAGKVFCPVCQRALQHMIDFYTR